MVTGPVPVPCKLLLAEMFPKVENLAFEWDAGDYSDLLQKGSCAIISKRSEQNRARELLKIIDFLTHN